MSIWICETSCWSQPYSIEYPICTPKFQWPRLAEYANGSVVIGVIGSAVAAEVWARKGEGAKMEHAARIPHAVNPEMMW